MRYGMMIDIKRCVGCAACVMACKMHNGTGRGVYWCNVITREEGTYPTARIHVLPIGCMHCTNAPCVRACPTGASHYDDDGSVRVDFEKCIGCRMCLGACPYNARYFNWGKTTDNPYFEGQAPTPYEELRAPEHPVGVAEKCTRCPDLTAKGMLPACVQTCPTKARIFGDLDDPSSEVNMAIDKRGAGFLMEEYGTRLSVYYAGLD